jgi:acetyl esterase/lipase
MISLFRDPFIDDNVEFARRLRDLKVPHHLTVVDEWPHGFLDFGIAATDIAQYNIEIINMLLKIVQQTSTNPGAIASVPSHID